MEISGLICDEVFFDPICNEGGMSGPLLLLGRGEEKPCALLKNFPELLGFFPVEK